MKPVVNLKNSFEKQKDKFSSCANIMAIKGKIQQTKQQQLSHYKTLGHEEDGIAVLGYN